MVLDQLEELFSRRVDGRTERYLAICELRAPILGVGADELCRLACFDGQILLLQEVVGEGRVVPQLAICLASVQVVLDGDLARALIIAI